MRESRLLHCGVRKICHLYYESENDSGENGETGLASGIEVHEHLEPMDVRAALRFSPPPVDALTLTSLSPATLTLIMDNLPVDHPEWAFFAFGELANEMNDK